MRKSLPTPVFLAALLGAGSVALAAESHDHGAASAATQGISATGTVKSVEVAAGKLVIAHDPIPALNWPAMTMDFRLGDKTLVDKVKSGDKVKFALTLGEKGSYTITAIELAR